MKRLIMMMTTIAVFLMPCIAMADWTINVTMESSIRSSSGQWRYRVKVSAISDGSDPAEFELDTSTLNECLSASALKELKGSMLWEVETDPGTAPDSAWSVSFDSGQGSDVLDLSSLSTTESQLHDASLDVGINHIMFDNLGIDIGDIGSENDSVDIYLIFIK